MGKKKKKRRKRAKRRGPQSIPSFVAFYDWAAKYPEETEDTKLYLLGAAGANRVMDIAVDWFEGIGSPGDTDISCSQWPFPRMFVGLKQLVEIENRTAIAWGIPVNAMRGRAGFLGMLYGASSTDPNQAAIVCTVDTQGPGPVGIFVLPIQGTMYGQEQVLAMFLAVTTLNEVKRGHPLNLEVTGGTVRKAAPTPSPAPLPEPFYPVNSGPGYAPPSAPPEEPGTPLRFRHDRCGSESVRVMRGELPMSDKRRRHLDALEYRIYDDRNRKLSAEDDKRLRRRGKRGRRPDEWLAIKHWWRRETVVGSDDLTYIPGIRS
jgi:hypothetical protein